MADDERLIESVREWLERGGYVLEMRVARLLRLRNLYVVQGYAYDDPTSGIDREGDISATVMMGVPDGHRHMLNLIIECKSTTAPWVGFHGTKVGRGPWLPASYMSEKCRLCQAMSDGYLDLRLAAPRAYALTEKRAKGVKDHAYEALQQAVSAALSLYAETTWDGHSDPSRPIVLGVPIVVTTSPLILCQLDADASKDVALTSVPRMNVAVPRRNVPESLDGMEVLVVRERELSALLEDLDALPRQRPSV